MLELNRRELLRNIAIGGVALCLPVLARAQERKPGEPHRKLGEPPAHHPVGRGMYYTDVEKRLIRTFMDVEADLRKTGGVPESRLKLLEMAERGDISQRVLFDVPWKGLVNAVALPQLEYVVRLVSNPNKEEHARLGMPEVDEFAKCLHEAGFSGAAFPADVDEATLYENIHRTYRHARAYHHVRHTEGVKVTMPIIVH